MKNQFKMPFEMATLFIILLCVLHVNASIKTYCKDGDECDDTWTPIDNLEAALVGYDLPSGNPFASDFIEDPGLKKQIFNATLESENDSEKYKLDSGISIREYQMCDTHFKTRLATSVKGYKKVSKS